VTQILLNKNFPRQGHAWEWCILESLVLRIKLIFYYRYLFPYFLACNRRLEKFSRYVKFSFLQVSHCQLTIIMKTKMAFKVNVTDNEHCEHQEYLCANSKRNLLSRNNFSFKPLFVHLWRQDNVSRFLYKASHTFIFDVFKKICLFLIFGSLLKKTL